MDDLLSADAGASSNFTTSGGTVTVSGKTGVAILMVEQNAKQSLNIADRGYVLVNGENRRNGSGQELLNDPDVRKSFLGG